MGREVSEWFPDGRGGGDTGESPWAVRSQPELVTFSLRAGKKNLSSESESRVEGLGSPSSPSPGSCRHLSPQPVSSHPPRVPLTTEKPVDALTSLWPHRARRGPGVKDSRAPGGSLLLVGISLPSCEGRVQLVPLPSAPLLGSTRASA